MSIYDRNEPTSSDSETESSSEPEADAPSDEPTYDEPRPRDESSFVTSDEDGFVDTDDDEAEAVASRGNAVALKLLGVPLLLAVCVPTLFVGLGRSSLWEPAEPRFADASRQMVASGDYLTPYFNGQPQFETPALFNWLQALSFRNLGVTEYTARMPAAFAGLGCVLLVFLIGLQLFGARAAVLGGFALATTFQFVVVSRSGVSDAPGLFFMLVGLYGFIRALETERPGGWFAVVAWIAVALGVLTQGLLGLMPLIVWVAYLVLTGRAGGFLRMRFATGVLLTLLIVSPWYFYMAWTHGRAFVEIALLADIMARYASANAQGSIDFALASARAWPAHAAPWTLYTLAAVAFSLLGWGSLEPERRGGVALCIIWIWAVFAACSLSGIGLPNSLLPLYPAGALLVGFLIDHAAARSTGARIWFGVSTWLTALGCVVLAGLSGWFLQRTFGAPFFSLGMTMPLALAAAGIFMVIFLRGGRPLWMFGTIAPVMAFGYAFVAIDTVPREVEPYKAVRPLADLIAAEPEVDRRVAVYNDESRGFVYYTRQNVDTLHTPDQVSAFLAEDGLRLCVMPDEDLESVRSRHSGTLYRIGSQPQRTIGIRDLLGRGRPATGPTLILISNRPPSD